MAIVLFLVLKGVYEIYWIGEKAALKQKPAVRYGLPLLIFLLILPYLKKYLF
jgi:hypothetical protein